MTIRVLVAALLVASPTLGSAAPTNRPGTTFRTPVAPQVQRMNFPPQIQQPRPQTIRTAGKSPVRTTGRRPTNRKPVKPQDPLKTAIKDLKQAEAELTKNNNAGATTRAQSAASLVENQLNIDKQPQAPKSGDVPTLKEALKEIKSAERAIRGKKTADATTNLGNAVTELEKLTGTAAAKKKN